MYTPFHLFLKQDVLDIFDLYHIELTLREGLGISSVQRHHHASLQMGMLVQGGRGTDGEETNPQRVFPHYPSESARTRPSPWNHSGLDAD